MLYVSCSKTLVLHTYSLSRFIYTCCIFAATTFSHHQHSTEWETHTQRERKKMLIEYTTKIHVLFVKTSICTCSLLYILFIIYVSAITENHVENLNFILHIHHEIIHYSLFQENFTSVAIKYVHLWNTNL